MPESPVPAPTPKPKLRWYQYRLRTFLLFGLGVSLGLSWYAVRSRPARNQLEAVARIHAAGGTQNTDPSGVYVTDVWFSKDSSVTDADLRHLQVLKRLEGLTIVQKRCFVTEAGLQHLEGLKSLRRLHLGGIPITDTGLKQLERLKSLRVLYLASIQIVPPVLKSNCGEKLTSLEYSNFGGNQITDAGLKPLEGLKSLQELAIGGDQITDAGLKHLAGLNCLERVALWGNGLTDAGLKHLERLPLRHLSLMNTQVTGAELERFPQLEWLRVQDSPITDAALKHLEGLAHLRQLELVCTSVTDAGLEDLKLPSLKRLTLDARLSGTDGVLAFREAHPECRVEYYAEW